MTHIFTYAWHKVLHLCLLWASETPLVNHVIRKISLPDLGTINGNKTVPRQDSSPTQGFETVPRHFLLFRQCFTLCFFPQTSPCFYVSEERVLKAL